MIENLLYPKKLAVPPRLDIDPLAMFGEITINDPNGTTGNAQKKRVSLIGVQTGDHDVVIKPMMALPLEGENLTPNEDWNYCAFSIRIPLKRSGSTSARLLTGLIPVPFDASSIEVDITRINCCGWNSSNADLISTPDKLVNDDKTLIYQVLKINCLKAEMPTYDLEVPVEPGNGKLFHIHGDDLVDGGNGPSFESIDRWSVISYEIFPDFYDNLIKNEPYKNMFNTYRNGTVALDLTLIVAVPGKVIKDKGFTLGISVSQLSPSA